MSGQWPSKRAYTAQPGSNFPSSRIVLWDNNTPDGGNTILLQITGNPNDPSSIPMREIYLPVIRGPINFYLGQTTAAGGTIDYTTEDTGCECVDFDGVYFVVLQYANGYPGAPAYVFLRNLPTGAFRTGPVNSSVVFVNVAPPLSSSGPPTSPTIGLNTPLSILFGGTGTDSPSLEAGAGISITGTPFNWEINLLGGIGTIQSIAVSPTGPNPPLSVTDPVGPDTIITMQVPVLPVNGGTGQSNPRLNAGTGIEVSGTIFDPGSWTVTNIGVTELNPGAQTGVVALESNDGSLNITAAGPNINIEIANPIGFSIAAVKNLDAGQINTSGASLSLGVLPAGTWFVEAICHGFGFTGSSGTIAMAGTGGMSSDGLAFVASTRTLYAATVLSGGDNPGVTVSGAAVNQNGASTAIACTIKAIRTA